GEINDDVVQFLNTGTRDRSLFLFVNYMDAHAPYLPPAPFKSLFQGPRDAIDYPSQKAAEREFLQNGRSISESYRQRLIAQYDGGLASQDASFGELMDELKGRGIY